MIQKYITAKHNNREVKLPEGRLLSGWFNRTQGRCGSGLAETDKQRISLTFNQLYHYSFILHVLLQVYGKVNPSAVSNGRHKVPRETQNHYNASEQLPFDSQLSGSNDLRLWIIKQMQPVTIKFIALL